MLMQFNQMLRIHTDAKHLGVNKGNYEMNITDEELLQQVQTLADKLPPEERQLILELLHRYSAVYSVAQSYIPDYPRGVLDALCFIQRNKP
ncbi:hypothetical protein [Klebsiella michiganensis]|uniref:Uncharacterized protein n=2 Tax=Klebsiella/Raoultella group TaxID=2890311 RepID=A0A2J4YIW9_9ENTR|nr:hypothetical protein [Klebsiella michiganensis]MBZ7134445.1 hypothetical protein [Klebsiella michiganensis]MDV1376632.1 hypothetical protein [Klebsiella michiganensis]PLM50701.1 hypothetical protein CWM85_30365 [Klebsiella michiganensis]RFC09574.1 hypothetical protein DDJ70_09755 [Klebsiella michiganensis]